MVNQNDSNIIQPLGSLESSSLASLGIVEADFKTKEDIYPIARGKGILNETLAALEMLSLYSNVPFRRDTLKKILEGQIKRDQEISVQILGGLSEILGFISQIGTVKLLNIGSIDRLLYFLLTIRRL